MPDSYLEIFTDKRLSHQRRKIGRYFTVLLFFLGIGLAWYGWAARVDATNIRNRERLWYDVVDGLPGGIVVVDALTGDILKWSNGMEEMFGILREAAIGKKAYEMPIVSATYQEKQKGFFNRAFHEKYNNRILTFICQGLHISGYSIELSVRVRSFEIAGKPLYVLFIDPVSSIVDLGVQDLES